VIFFLVFIISIITLFFLNLSLKRERDLLKQKDNFVNAVSHELRTPIAGIRLCAETMFLGRIRDASYVKNYSKKILEQSDYLTSLVNNILDFSRMKKGHQDFVMEEMNISELLPAIVEQFQFSVSAENPAFSLDIAEGLPPVKGDRNALTRVFNNIFENAVKYSPGEKWIGIKAILVNNCVTISVQDRGIGIEKQHQKKIFKHFYRVQDEKSRFTKGTGLGLALVKYIVEKHRGKITIESIAGSGSTFTVFLPVLNKKAKIIEK